ncbi:MAG: hypothetical protein VKL39_13705 [Leptolyngbyaceae bacterium]|nr:hypothetical protein [Leptolyngbyaceae bacterium]
MIQIDAFGYFDSRSQRPFEQFTPEYVTGIAAARRWISRQTFVRTPYCRRSANSYKLKHVMERDCGVYVPNGVFILAMVEEGFRAKRLPDSKNAAFNIEITWEYYRASHLSRAPQISSLTYLKGELH